MDKFVIRKPRRLQDSSSTQDADLTQDSSSTQDLSSKHGRVDVNNLLNMVVILIHSSLIYFRFYIIYVSYSNLDKKKSFSRPCLKFQSYQIKAQV